MLLKKMNNGAFRRKKVISGYWIARHSDCIVEQHFIPHVLNGCTINKDLLEVIIAPHREHYDRCIKLVKHK